MPRARTRQTAVGAEGLGSRVRDNGIFAVAMLCLVSVSLGGCFLTPAVNRGDYRNKAGNSAQAMVSIVNSAILAVQLDLEGRSTETVTNDLVSSSEMDAGSVITAFDSRQPPDPGSQNLMDRVDGPLQAASADLTSLRIAVREGDAAAMRSDVRELRAPVQKLDQLEELHS